MSDCRTLSFGSLCARIALVAACTVFAGTAAHAQASLNAAGRILNQTTFGPTYSELNTVEQIGVKTWVAQQINQPAFVMPNVIPAIDYEIGDCNVGWPCMMEAAWWQDAIYGQDQLRQRVAYALSKLFVVSLSEVDARYYPYYLNVLSKDAFGNWFTLMQDVSMSAAMGTYLNSANSLANGGQADENFARELMQLFSIGTNQLNQDGSLKLDGNGNPIPNYTPAIVQSFAKAYTGFTFANADCSAPAAPQYYWWPLPPGQGCPMAPIAKYHDASQKTLLRGVTLPAGQSPTADFTAALNNVFTDPSLPPFVSRRLIQNLVKSNPSPAYISRIAAVFTNDGNGVRGNMAAVISAILLDPEARADDTASTPDPKDGLMRDPMLWWISILRTLEATQNLPSPFVGVYEETFDLWLTDLGETSHSASSVFSFYSPDNTINGGTLYAPEFQLENSSSIAEMAEHGQNLIANNIPTNAPGEFSLDLSANSQLGQIAKSQGPAGLVSILNAVLMHGTMSAEMSASIVTAISGGWDIGTMVRNAVYLIVTSPQYRIMI